MKPHRNGRVTTAPTFPTLPKCPTGIQGLDEITNGGLPRGRPTLICGGAGCGKTLLAMEFIVRGITQYGEPGVFMAFEERENDLAANVRSLGFDLARLVARKQLVIDSIQIERSEIEETGEYNLEGLFIRLGQAIDSIGAKRVVLDTVETLFGGLANDLVLRSELRRLFRWLKDKGVTAVVTGEQGAALLTRQGLEEYVSDCVIALDHRIMNQMSTRRLRIVKYRGAAHGTNEYPFLVGEQGLSVLPITSLSLAHKASTERVSSGVAQLDTMLGGKGYYRGSTVLVSGMAGTGKSSIAASFAHAACLRGERCLYVSFEESPSQICRNMRSIGMNLAPWIDKGLLHMMATRPAMYGLEQHLVVLHQLIEELKPSIVVLDPCTALLGTGVATETKSMLMRLFDHLKLQGITTLITTLTSADTDQEHTSVLISSLVDTWLLLRDLESSGERNRGLYVIKSRGMSHSNQIREFLLTDAGVALRNVYVGPGGALTGAARLSQEAQDQAGRLAREVEVTRLKHNLAIRRKAMEGQVASLRAEHEAEANEAQAVFAQLDAAQRRLDQDRIVMAGQRQADAEPTNGARARKERLHAHKG